MHLIKRVAVAAAVFITVLAPVASSQVVFNEVLVRRGTGGSHSDQIIELKNVGASAVNIGGWVFCHQFIYSGVIPAGTTIPAGGFIVFHFNQSGTNTATNIFFPGNELDDISDCGLYVNGNNFTSAANMRAFIQWGGVPGSGRQSVAQQAGLWTSGTFVPAVAPDHSIELCATDSTTPSSFVDQSTPTLGLENGCGVSVETVSWGRVKALFQ